MAPVRNSTAKLRFAASTPLASVSSCSPPLTVPARTAHDTPVVDSDAQANVIEIELRHSRETVGRIMRRLPLLLVIALFSTCALVPLLFAAFAMFRSLPTVVVSPCLLAVIYAVWRLVDRARRKASDTWRPQVRQAVTEQGLAAGCAAWVQRFPERTAWLANRELCQELAQAGYCGTVRMGPANPALVAPFLHPFEARVLNERDASFREFVQAATLTEAGAPRRSQPAGSSLWPRYAWVLVMVPAGIALVQELSKAATSGQLSGFILPATVVLAVLAAAFVLAPLWPVWLVVPGGVLVRRTHLHRPTALRLFTGRACLLIAVATEDHWRVAVADAHGAAARNLSQCELDTLLRAWLSPLPPPALETLSDLQ